MTRTTTARVAGAAFLFYIVVGISAAVLSARATGDGDVAARLATVPQHLTALRFSLLFALLSAGSAFVLAVTLHGLTRDEDREIALFGFVFRAGEGILGSFQVTTLGLLWLATASGPTAPDGSTANTIATLLLKLESWQAQTSALLFSLGSLAFAWLFLRGRMIPVALARLGVVASILLIAGLPLQMAGLIGGIVAMIVMWLPMLVFELWLAGWLIVRGVVRPVSRTPASAPSGATA